MKALPTIRKTYRRLFCRKGHGVHSPFVFRLITRVIGERLPFYAFDEIKRQIPSDKEFTHPYGQLLFRLVNHLKPNAVIRVGKPALPDLYLQKALPATRELHLVSGLKEAKEAGRAEMLVIDGLADTPDENLINWLVENKAVVIISNIQQNKGQKEMWQQIIRHPQTRICIDTWGVGIAFFEQKLHKKLYKTYFDYGKK